MIEALETAMVDWLTRRYEAQKALRIKTIEAYGGQFDTADEFARAAALAPALWVTFEGESGRLANPGQYEGSLSFAVFALARNFRPEELRRGGPETVGLYQLAAFAKAALSGQSLAGAGLLIPTSVRPLWRGGPQGGGVSLMLLNFSAEYAEGFAPEAYPFICERPRYVIDWAPRNLEIVATDLVSPKGR